MKNTRANAPTRMGRIAAILTASALCGGLYAASSPALAQTQTIRGQQYTGQAVYPTVFRDTNARNSDQIIIDTAGGGGGAPVYAGLTRAANASSYATTRTETFRKWTYFTNKSSGTVSNPPGAFYLRLEFLGGCGNPNGGCAPIDWTGRLNFNNAISGGVETPAD